MSSRMLLVVAALSAGCSLFKFTVDTPATRAKAAEEQAAQAEAARVKSEQEAKLAEEKRAAEQAARDQAIVVEFETLRNELAAGPDAAKAIAFAAKVADAKGSPAASDGRLDLPKLQAEAIEHLERALAAAPSYELFLALDRAVPEADPEGKVKQACAKVRPSVPAETLADFVGICLARAGGDPKQLKWAGVKADLAALRKAEEARAREEKAAAEEAAANAKKGIGPAIAAVFAAGRCNFGNCMKDGWTISTPAGEVRVRCNFGNCLKDGWSASFPDGSEARTRCSFGDCMKDGWETTFADGTSANTRCSFGNCAKDGWETSFPGGGSARTRCSFGDCFKDGWETSMPDGRSVRCRCNFSKCLTDGTTCE